MRWVGLRAGFCTLIKTIWTNFSQLTTGIAQTTIEEDDEEDEEEDEE